MDKTLATQCDGSWSDPQSSRKRQLHVAARPPVSPWKIEEDEARPVLSYPPALASAERSCLYREGGE